VSAQTIELNGRPAELLLIEDNYGDVLLTLEAFSRAKISNNMMVVSDGEEALRLLRREDGFAAFARPDLILLDLNLPRLDGRGVLEAIKGDADLQRIPVIIMTSSSAESDVLMSYKLNANGYVVKPVDFDRLTQIVASIESFWFSVVVLAAAPAIEQSRAA
jgi:CheY-like chemotaxis protein